MRAILLLLVAVLRPPVAVAGALPPPERQCYDECIDPYGHNHNACVCECYPGAWAQCAAAREERCPTAAGPEDCRGREVGSACETRSPHGGRATGTCQMMDAGARCGCFIDLR